ncbi:ABC transporter substrate-binding protein [Pseudobacteriovorax antillogorgiicola]|uniref:Carbohydrate ABC transporter substrate-binding protein, CUT1 family n=1 Tax=Pseudobacteriovorax antillogorgiicola TaxID=1513793 RepID=A0A1Y6CL33_9BACT|nr:ABC transporter substrate-binding protein [Pseudobacteriovorax antillogorgiicola]TCS47628.1 carbohydrate ABC transporter substrate-binding protein (CUT1 family) [Pseudobacteriovorax antillogorgiicola]SMF59985.1 carbohydrate ABC transporter substrate-binding protein, CUT1 family [Pseudobacteriovorax antillogorgiicola]
MKICWISTLGVALLGSTLGSAETIDKKIDKWLSSEFHQSVLSPKEQKEELLWFHNASKPYKGMTIKVVSETIDTHTYESKVLTKAFEDITGIKVEHDLIGEGDVIEKLQTEFQTGRSIYDMYVNDSDLIGTHSRNDYVVALSDFMKKEGKSVTLPTLDIDDFIGKSFTTGPDGKLYQLPDQQFANLYWFRYDWFQKPELQKQFKEKYGYDLGVPVNWSAYEDIADFFTNVVKEIDGKKVYGHMDYGKKDPSLGWRFTDAWLSMAGTGSKGLPNGLPVDEWGIRSESCHPVGASMDRGGAVNAPASVYALSKYIDWMKQYAPPEAMGMTFSEAGPVPAQGQIAQQIFWYTAFTASSLKKGLDVVNEDGTPKWRMAPSPHGPYWEDGMKLGYQDAGSWTMLKHTPLKRRQAAWLYAQFTVSKSVSLTKFIHGLTPIRESDINSPIVTKLAPKLGGLVEFYRSPARTSWTPTGNNVPDYPRLSQLWWQNISLAISGEKSPQQAMDQLGTQMDSVLKRLQRAGMKRCEPKLAKNPKGSEYWLKQPGSPKPKLANEKPKGQTIPYDQLLKQWQEYSH